MMIPDNTSFYKASTSLKQHILDRPLVVAEKMNCLADFFTLTSYGDHLEYTNKDQTFCFTEVSDTFINNHLSLYVTGNSIEKPIMTNHVKEAG